MSEKANVYFSKEISPEKVLEMYQLLGKKLDGKVAIKLHSGEAGNQNFLKPEFWKPVIDYVGGTVVECNTAYEGERNTTAKHKKTLEAHGWSRYFKVDLLDAEGPDLEMAAELCDFFAQRAIQADRENCAQSTQGEAKN